MPEAQEKFIIIPEGTEINDGPSEDSDSVVAKEPLRAIVMGEEAEGAIPVKIIKPDGQPDEQIRYFHQPPKPAK